jgi:2-keto-4-pentenoate hydratase/2-oxohepta-3-ene-1,7-dioic acid hydratase in catechol pathway
MKLATYRSGATTSLGAVLGDSIVDLKALSLPGTMLALIQGGPDMWRSAARLAQGATVTRTPLAGVSLLAPLPNPGKLIAIGLNYMDHCREQKVQPPARPLIFAKFPTAIIGQGDTICWDANITKQVDYEVELGVIIGKRTKNATEANALDAVFGYTIINDISARDLQFSDGQWVRAKSLDTFAPMGPVILTADEVADPQALKLRCTLNGQVMQNSSTKEMIFGVRYLIADLSRNFTLQPGDIITTGTPDGVGVFRNPKVFLKDGDVIECEIEGIGKLRNVTKLV